MEVLLLLAKGIKVKEIATKLFITSKTVNAFRYRMHRKVELKMVLVLFV